MRSNYTKGWTCDGQPVYDCVGLIKGSVWCNGVYGAEPKYVASQDYSANGMLAACKTKGKIKTLPEVPGVLVFKTGHVGVYIGNGVVIHAAGHNKGVIRDKLANVAWTDWGYCPLIEYTNKKAIENAFTQAFNAAKEEEKKQQTVTPTAKTQTVTFTHKVTKGLNVRRGPSIAYKRLTYDDFPDYIKKQMKRSDILTIGIKIHCYENRKGWYRIDKDRQVWIAGNYCTKI